MTMPATTVPGKGARAEAQRERILASAKQCFIERGFHAATMATIAEAAGMSPGLVYRYVENKSAIVRAIIEEQLAKIRADIATRRSRRRSGHRTGRPGRRWSTGCAGRRPRAVWDSIARPRLRARC
jgi:AcrR family transcriptional regulator